MSETPKEREGGPPSKRVGRPSQADAASSTDSTVVPPSRAPEELWVIVHEVGIPDLPLENTEDAAIELAAWLNMQTGGGHNVHRYRLETDSPREERDG